MNVSTKTWLTLIGCVAFVSVCQPVNSFVSPTSKLSAAAGALKAAPKRLEENVEGVVYVNDKCINCAACANFAPSVFKRADTDRAHVVHHQPTNEAEILDARAAMAACPVAAIRSETLAQRRHRMADTNGKEAVEKLWTQQDDNLVKQMALSPKLNALELPFPRPFMHHEVVANGKTSPSAVASDVYNLGHHNERSFGATPYLMQAKINGNPNVWIMVDTPKFSKSALDAVKSITGEAGPQYLFLTHVDDTADHDKWVEEFPNHLQRIFHKGDTGRHNWLRDRKLDNEVEIMLPLPPTTTDKSDEDAGAAPFSAYSVEGKLLPNDWYNNFMKDEDNDVVILHTPGHSPGSITLWKKPTNGQPGIIFTGDHYAYTTRTGRMTGFPQYGNNMQVQAKSLENLLQLDWDLVAPGHGHPRDYSNDPNKEELKRQEMQEAIMDLHK